MEFLNQIDAVRGVLDPIILCVGYAILLVIAILIFVVVPAQLIFYRLDRPARIADAERQRAEAQERERVEQLEREWAAAPVGTYTIATSEGKNVPAFRHNTMSLLDPNGRLVTVPVGSSYRDPALDRWITTFTVQELPGCEFITDGDFAVLKSTGGPVVMKILMNASGRPERAQVVTELRKVFTDCRVYVRYPANFRDSAP